MAQNKSYKLHLDCECCTPDHICRFSFWDNDEREEPEMMVAVQLNRYDSWYERIIPAIKYIFGGDSAGWDETIFKPADVERLSNMCKDYIDTRDAYLKSFEESK
mgnify:CR=1 FL=1